MAKINYMAEQLRAVEANLNLFAAEAAAKIALAAAEQAAANYYEAANLASSYYIDMAEAAALAIAQPQSAELLELAAQAEQRAHEEHFLADRLLIAALAADKDYKAKALINQMAICSAQAAAAELSKALRADNEANKIQ